MPPPTPSTNTKVRYTVMSGSTRSTPGELPSSPTETPDTTLSAFSPENQQHLVAESPFGGSIVGNTKAPDPFTSTPFSTTSFTTASHGSGKTVVPGPRKLSAKASAFAPASYKATKLVEQTPSKPSKAEPYNVPDPLLLDLVTTYGKFSTDEGTSRNIQVQQLHPGGHHLESLIEAVVLELVTHGAYQIKGDNRKHVVGNTVYLRYPNIQDSVQVHGALKRRTRNLAINFVNPSVFKAASPTSRRYSAHEGQVIITATYPTDADIDRVKFENGVRDHLVYAGGLKAWQKLMGTPQGELSILAEFDDADVAPTRVKELDGRVLEVGENVGKGKKAQLYVKLACRLHEPDLPSSTDVFAPKASPSPAQLAMDELDKLLSKMSPSDKLGSYGPRTVPTYPFSNSALYDTNVGLGMMGGTNYGTSFGTGNYQSFYPPSMSPYHGYGYGTESSYGYAGQSYGGVNGYGGASSFASGFSPSPYTPGGYGSGSSSFGNFSQNYPSPFPGGAASHEMSSPSRVVRENSIQIPRPRGRKDKEKEEKSNHNTVYVENIRSGTDVRTTIMLRNIPNKLNQRELKSIVDQTSFGLYDFMYLRIDFSNECNVGYAFINFTDPLDIIPFLFARSNKRWFRSDKVAEISYATIQGKDCLVQKFRNSSVMLEPLHFRPKLFYTKHDPDHLCGDEQPFPASDNASKLKRSCENAEHVGLFAPSHGQHMRDEQRRRKSQYDRGTSLAERDELGYDLEYTRPGPSSSGAGPSSYGYY